MHAEAAQGSSVLKEARALRDKLGDVARRAKSNQQRAQQARQKEAQRKRDEAERAEAEAEAQATAAHVAEMRREVKLPLASSCRC